MRPSALLAIALLALAGCPPPPVARPYPPPTAADLIAHLEKRAAPLRSLRAEAKVDYLAGRGERVKVQMTFLVEPPDRLRLEADSPLGGAVASLASDGKRFALLEVRDNRFLAGPARPCNIARLIRVALSPADVVAVATGGAPLLGAGAAAAPSEKAGGAAPAAPEVSWDGRDGGREVLTLHGEGGLVETLRLDARDRAWDVREAELRGPDGKVVYRIEHEGFSDQSGVRLPERTTITQPARDADTRIRWQTREANVQVPANVFELPPPPGISVENVECE
jgi:hypothetical protein